MKCEIELKLGDVVKSLDFININDSYFIGKIIHIDEERGEFRAKIIERIWEGKSAYFAGEIFVTPLPGMMLLDDLGTRIQVLA